MNAATQITAENAATRAAKMAHTSYDGRATFLLKQSAEQLLHADEKRDLIEFLHELLTCDEVDAVGIADTLASAVTEYAEGRASIVEGAA